MRGTSRIMSAGSRARGSGWSSRGREWASWRIMTEAEFSDITRATTRELLASLEKAAMYGIRE